MKTRILFTAIMLIAISLSCFADTSEKAVTYLQKPVTITTNAANIVGEFSKGRSVYVKNNDTAGTIYLNLTTTATASNTNIVLAPGEYISIGNSTNAISAIGDIASNANVVVIEGR